MEDGPTPLAPDRLSSNLTHAELELFLVRADASPGLKAIGPSLRSNITGALLFDMLDTGMSLKRAFTSVDDDDDGLLELEAAGRKMLRIEAAAAKEADRDAKRKGKKTARDGRAAGSSKRPTPLLPVGSADKPLTPMCEGEAPPAIVKRSFAEIAALAKANKITSKASMENAPRAKLETEGWTGTFTIAAEEKLGDSGSELHNYLVGKGTEHFNSVLAELGCTGSYDREESTATITFSGETLASFFKVYLDKRGNKLNPAAPVKQQQFFGAEFMSKIYRAAPKKTRDLVQKNTVVQLEQLKAKEFARVEAAYQTRIDKLEGEIGKHEAAIRRLRREACDEAKEEAAMIMRHKEGAEKLLDAEEAKKKLEKDALKMLWDDHIEKRRLYDSEVAQKHKENDKNTREANELKKATHAASAAQAQAALSRATAVAATVDKEVDADAAMEEVEEVAAPAAVVDEAVGAGNGDASILARDAAQKEAAEPVDTTTTTGDAAPAAVAPAVAAAVVTLAPVAEAAHITEATPIPEAACVAPTTPAAAAASVATLSPVTEAAPVAAAAHDTEAVPVAAAASVGTAATDAAAAPTARNLEALLAKWK